MFLTLYRFGRAHLQFGAMRTSRPVEPALSRPVVRADRAGRLDGLLGKVAERLLRGIRNDAHSDASDALFASGHRLVFR